MPVQGRGDRDDVERAGVFGLIRGVPLDLTALGDRPGVRAVRNPPGRRFTACRIEE
jgi:hypothetical protein